MEDAASVGTNPTEIHRASIRMSRVTTAASAASDPMTTTRTGSSGSWGALTGDAWCGTSGCAAISSSEGVESTGR